MADDLFYTFKAPSFDDPLKHLKGMLAGWQEEIKSAPNRNIRERLEMSIRNLKDFLDFIGKEIEPGIISYLEKTNIHPQTYGTDSVLLIASDFSSKHIEGSLKEKMVKAVYPDGGKCSRRVYFVKMKIPGTYAWWEKGETTQESFGAVSHDVFRGFVRIG